MPRGGSRNRSGPAADPSSERSERRGVRLTALPAEGREGKPPTWPLPKRSAYTVGRDENGKPFREYDEGETQEVAARELELWAWAWSLPQACAWSLPSEAWRLHTIAMWVRTYVICESNDATAADKSSLHRFADQIGLTPAGLKENGWAIAQDELGAKAADKAEAEKATAPRARRLRPVADAK